MTTSKNIKSITCKYTVHARPHYGYHDSETRVVFNDGVHLDVQETEMKELEEELKKRNMWTYPAKAAGSNTWTINHGYDSGD